MLNRKIYEKLELELAKSGIAEDADEVLLLLAEKLDDSARKTASVGKEMIEKEKFGKNTVTAAGILENQEGETALLVRWLKIGDTRIEIDDYII